MTTTGCADAVDTDTKSNENRARAFMGTSYGQNIPARLNRGIGNDEMHPRLRQRAVNPPSTIRLCPVTKDDLGEHSHRTASATSSTRPMRPMGCKVERSSFVRFAFAITRSLISVSITAGLTALMRIPCAEYSTAAFFV